MELALVNALDSSGFTLGAFSMQRSVDWSIKIDRMKLSSTDAEISLFDIEINPLGFSDFAVNIKRVNLRLIPDQSRIRDPLDWRTLFESIGDSIPLLPERGTARHVEVCIEECLTGELSWIRHAEAVEGHFQIHEEHLLGSLLLTANKSTFSITGYRDNPLIVEIGIMGSDAEEVKLTGRARFIADKPRYHLDGKTPVRYSVDITSLDAHLEGKLPLDSLVTTASVRQQFDGRLILSSNLDWQVSIADTTLSSQEPVTIEFELNKGILHSTLSSPVLVDVRNPRVEKASLIVAADSRCVTSKVTTCTIPGITLTAKSPPYFADAAISSILVNLDKDNWQLSAFLDLTVGEAVTESTDKDNAPEGVNLITAGINLTADNKALTATTDNARLPGLSAINITINHSLQTDKGNLWVHAERSATELMGLTNYLGIQDFRIEAGEITFTANLGWDLQSNASDLSFSAEIIANNLNLDVAGYELRKGSIHATLTGWPGIQTTTPATMTWNEIDIGVPISDIQMSFGLDLQMEEELYKVTGESLTASLFGGTIESNDYAFDLARKNGHLTLKLDRLELQQILALQQENFESTGKISGSVPVHIEGGILSVSNGTISAIEPGGTIRYKPSLAVVGLVARNDQLKVVVDTMSDFQYHSLEAILEYTPEGNLVARTALKGSNQAFENGREIHLNVNLEENLADLLKSLRLSNEVSRNLTRRAKEGVR